MAEKGKSSDQNERWLEMCMNAEKAGGCPESRCRKRKRTAAIGRVYCGNDE